MWNFKFLQKRSVLNLTVIPLLSLITLVTGCDKHMTTGSSSLKLLTYNIHYGANSDGVFNLEATIETIRSSGAEIIALQEVDRVWGGRSSYCDEPRYIAQELSMSYVFGATLDTNSLPGVGEYGIMLLSKYKIVDSAFRLLPSVLEQRGVLLCFIETPEGVIPVACTHLGLSVSDRKNQIADILRWLPQKDTLLLLGDFNTEPESEELCPLYNRLTDIQDVYGLGNTGTFFYGENWVRIDYIFAGNRWYPNFCRVIPAQSSDHLPVYAELKTVDY